MKTEFKNGNVYHVADSGVDIHHPEDEWCGLCDHIGNEAVDDLTSEDLDVLSILDNGQIPLGHDGNILNKLVRLGLAEDLPDNQYGQRQAIITKAGHDWLTGNVVNYSSRYPSSFESKGNEWGEFELPDDDIMYGSEQPDDFYLISDAQLSDARYNMSYDELRRHYVDAMKEALKQAGQYTNYYTQLLDGWSTHTAMFDVPYSIGETPTAQQAFRSAKEEVSAWWQEKLVEDKHTYPTPTWESRAREVDSDISEIVSNRDYELYDALGYFGIDPSGAIDNYPDSRLEKIVQKYREANESVAKEFNVGRTLICPKCNKEIDAGNDDDFYSNGNFYDRGSVPLAYKMEQHFEQEHTPEEFGVDRYDFGLNGWIGNNEYDAFHDAFPEYSQNDAILVNSPSFDPSYYDSDGNRKWIYDKESLEKGTPDGDWLWSNYKWNVSMDQDDIECKRCGYWLRPHTGYADDDNILKEARKHLKEKHGIEENMLIKDKRQSINESRMKANEERTPEEVWSDNDPFVRDRVLGHGDITYEDYGIMSFDGTPSIKQPWGHWQNDFDSFYQSSASRWQDQHDSAQDAMLHTEWKDLPQRIKDGITRGVYDQGYQVEWEDLTEEQKELYRKYKGESRIKAIENVDIGYEKIQPYPTKANEAEEDDYVTVDNYDGIYDEKNIRDSGEEVDELVKSRKMNGYGTESIMNELMIKYGASQDEAWEKVGSVEVSVNDKFAFTFFGKSYKECNEAEIQELKLYAGDVN